MASFELSGTRVEYVEQGCGEPVLLLHSSGSSNSQWRSLIERLSHRFRVIAPDLYGYGATSHWPGHRAFSLACDAQIVRALLERAQEPAHLVGHSYGGAVALHVARLQPGVVRSLTLIEPVAFHLLRGQDAQALAEIIEVAGMVATALACGDYAGGFGRFVDYWSGPGCWFDMPEAKRSAVTPRLAKVALDFHATLNEPAQIDDCRGITLPTLVLQGACSPRPTRRICELIAHALPDASIRTIEGASHMLPLTHRDAVNALIAAHLDSHRAAYLSAA
jgi:pimeloyl-ACP methyl ester carboxylesterase